MNLRNEEMLDIGLGVRLIAVAAAPAPPVPAPLGKPPSSLRHRCSSWLLSNGNAHGRRDSTTTSSRATRRRWWSDGDGSQEDYGSSSLEDEGDYDYEGEAAFSRFGWAEELFDESWFSKVSKVYGSVLPVMLVSMFAATGLKAFLMAMAIPLSQSAISSFLLRRKKGNRDDWWMFFFKKNNRWRRPFQEKEYSSISSNYERVRRRRNYQSWVSKDFADAAASTAVGADDNIKNRNSSSGGYGGWDELLDNSTAAAQEAKERSSNSYSQLPTLITARNRGLERLGRKMRMPRTRRRRMPRTTGLDTTEYKQTPLLMMRLLVAVFPFLGSWFRLL